MQELEHSFDHAFVSYNSRDGLAVQGVIDELRALRPELQLWYDKSRIELGREVGDALFEPMDRSRSCLVFVGENRLGPHQADEVSYAMQKYRASDGAFRIIPVLLGEFDLLPRLRCYVGVAWHRATSELRERLATTLAEAAWPGSNLGTSTVVCLEPTQLILPSIPEAALSELMGCVSRVVVPDDDTRWHCVVVAAGRMPLVAERRLFDAGTLCELRSNVANAVSGPFRDLVLQHIRIGSMESGALFSARIRPVHEGEGALSLDVEFLVPLAGRAAIKDAVGAFANAISSGDRNPHLDHVLKWSVAGLEVAATSMAVFAVLDLFHGQDENLWLALPAVVLWLLRSYLKRVGRRRDADRKVGAVGLRVRFDAASR